MITFDQLQHNRVIKIIVSKLTDLSKVLIGVCVLRQYQDKYLDREDNHSNILPCLFLDL